MRVVIIGSGNLAEALARAVWRSDLQLVQVFARNRERAAEIAQIAECEWSSGYLAEADIYLIAVSDKAILEVASTLTIPECAIVAHTAASVPVDAIPARFTRRAVFYPLQTFTKGREVDFAQIPVFLETDNEALCGELEAFARRLSQHIFWSDLTQRTQLHLAAVFACNFVNRMYAVSETLVKKAGLPFDVLKPLIAETAAKALLSPSPADVQTGPAVRGDIDTQNRHISLLEFDEELKAIYDIISKNIWETSKKI